jgi:cysteine-rich repeat protein
MRWQNSLRLGKLRFFARAFAIAAQPIGLLVWFSYGCTSPKSAFDRAEVSSTRSSDRKSIRAESTDAGEQRDATMSDTSGSDSPDAGDADERPDAGDFSGDVTACGDGKVNGAERCDTAIAAGKAGACPERCGDSKDACEPMHVVGTECDARCEPMKLTARMTGDLCCPNGANASNDGDCAPICGNGVTEAGETCDPPDSCPKCAESSACVRVAASGTPEACNRVCETTAISACAANDGCCPSGCTPQTDSDCSARCGDGVVDRAAGETCEPSSAAPCPQDCRDDDPCTEDLRTGSDMNCNVACTHVAIGSAINGDGCCWQNTNANADSDCPAVCGNGIVEPGEACDDANQLGGDGCTATCTRETAAQMCLAGRANDACSQCTCDNCRSAAAGCRPDGEDGALCTELAACMSDARCSGLDCYCGDNLLGCVAGVADGKCSRLIEQALGSRDVVEIVLVLTLVDASSLIGRAMSLSVCQRNACDDECPR